MRDQRAAAGSSSQVLSSLATGSLALVRDEMPLADADRLGRDLDQLVIGDELDGVFERELNRRRKRDGFILARGADIGELLSLDRIDDEIVVAAVDPDHHALV